MKAYPWNNIFKFIDIFSIK